MTKAFERFLGAVTIAAATIPSFASASFECNQVIATYTSTDDVASLFRSLTSPLLQFQALAEDAIIPAIQNGIQVRKVCASCAEYPNDELCPSNVNGFDVTHSGLLVVPLVAVDGTTANDEAPAQVILPGTERMNLHFHGVLRHPQAAPSASWPPNILVGSGFDIFLGLAFTATSGTYTLL